MKPLSDTTALILIFSFGLLTWILFTYLIYRIDLALAPKLKLTFLLILNVFLGTFFALLQLILIHFWANFFTGFGLGIAISFVAILCCVGMLFSLLGILAYLFNKGVVSDR